MLCVLIKIVSTYQYFIEDRKHIPKLSSVASWPGAMNNPQRLELPLSGTNFHGPKNVEQLKFDCIQYQVQCTLVTTATLIPKDVAIKMSLLLYRILNGQNDM